MGLLDRVGLFDRNKMDKKAGEWAAKAMGCMVFADGNGAGAAEIAAAHEQAKTNRVLKDSIGRTTAAKGTTGHPGDATACGQGVNLTAASVDPL